MCGERGEEREEIGREVNSRKEDIEPIEAEVQMNGVSSHRDVECVQIVRTEVRSRKREKRQEQESFKVVKDEKYRIRGTSAGPGWSPRGFISRIKFSYFNALSSSPSSPKIDEKIRRNEKEGTVNRRQAAQIVH